MANFEYSTQKSFCLGVMGGRLGGDSSASSQSSSVMGAVLQSQLCIIWIFSMPEMDRRTLRHCAKLVR